MNLGVAWMYNEVIIGIYVPFLLMTAVIFASEFFRCFKRKGNYLFLQICFCILCWFLCEISSLLATNSALPNFFWNSGLVFAGFTPVILFLFVLGFYRESRKLSAIKTVFLFAVPVINAIIALTSDSHALMRELTVVSLTPVRNIAGVWGPWFWVNTAYDYILLIATMGIIFFEHFHMPKFYRLSSRVMILGIALTISGNAISLMGILPVNLEPTLIAVSLVVLFMRLAIVNNDRSIFVRFSRGQIFHYLDVYILVLGENNYVADYNRPAYDWLSYYGITLNSSTLQDVMEALVQKGATMRESSENTEGVDICFSGGTFPVTLNLRIHEIPDAKGNVIGSIAIFTDVTENRMLLEQLEVRAGMDSLTGLANHMAFEGARSRLDNPEHLPLSVVMCDVNGLKNVNDTMGHQHGDMMLRVVAKTLEDECPKNGFLARIGGDEFIFLLSKTHHDAASAFIEQIKKSFCDCGALPFSVSVALGTATKYSADENLTDVITSADNRMYSDKEQMKKQVG